MYRPKGYLLVIVIWILKVMNITNMLRFYCLLHSEVKFYSVYHDERGQFMGLQKINFICPKNVTKGKSKKILILGQLIS